MQGFVATHLSARRGPKLNVINMGAMDLNVAYETFFDDPR
jgi:hypothetical protein